MEKNNYFNEKNPKIKEDTKDKNYAYVEAIRVLKLLKIRKKYVRTDGHKTDDYIEGYVENLMIRMTDNQMQRVKEQLYILRKLK